jgi:bifunctional DNA-binding transcriptional regulator/antitoxin component of YhaV-PrlF toxin-antitoxin module
MRFLLPGQTLGRGEPRGRAILSTMKHGTTATMDSAGRLILPKEILDEARLEPGMPLRIWCHDGRVEIEPLPREVQVVRKGRMRVAVPVEEGNVLENTAVRETVKSVRERR